MKFEIHRRQGGIGVRKEKKYPASNFSISHLFFLDPNHRPYFHFIFKEKNSCALKKKSYSNNCLWSRYNMKETADDSVSKSVGDEIFCFPSGAIALSSIWRKGEG